MVSSIQSPEVINFGKFKGTPLNELKPSYVHWLLKLENLNSDLREKLEAIDAERERKFQRRKAAAIMFSKPCFQRDRYSANQRIAYNNAKYNKGL